MANNLSLRERFALLPVEEQIAYLSKCEPWMLEEMARMEWWWTARPNQIPPENGNYFVALALAGRGFGKSRAGAEWLVQRIKKHPFDSHGVPTEWLVISETLGDTRAICMEGPSGILRSLERQKVVHKYIRSPRPMVIFPDGQKIYCEGADDEDVGRGYNAAGGWLDEIAKWKNAYGSWYEGIMPSMRADLIGDHPQVFVTTTPKPDKLIIEWNNRDDGTVYMMRGSTFDNANNLSAMALAEMKSKYEGTNLGLQELYGELIEAMDGALFRRSDMESNRVYDAPDDIIAICVGVDPALTDEGDEMGVVVVARTRDDHLWCLADASVRAVGREAAKHCWRTLALWGADCIVLEQNLGKNWMEEVFRDAYFELMGAGEMPESTTPPLIKIDARHGKRTRAEPVAMRSQQGRIHMVGEFDQLEEQLTMFTGWDGKESPDRLDAFVHACRHLMNGEKSRARVHSPLDYFPQLASWDL